MISYHARWVIPITAPPIEHGTVVVNSGRITRVGPRSRAANGEWARDGGPELDLGEALLMPGLVNVHTHLDLTVMRGFLEDLEFTQWIRRLTEAKRAVLDRERLLDSARLGLVEGVSHGITTYGDTCDSPVALDAMVEAGVRGISYQEVFGPDPARCAESLAELQSRVAALRARETALVKVGVSPHAPYSVSDALFAAVAGYARQESLPIAVHIAESEAERELVEDGDGPFAARLRQRGIAVAPRARSSIELLQSAGILDARTLLIHCVRVDADDIGHIARGRSAVAHCPVSNAKLGHGTSPLLELLEAGVTVGIGTDSVASNNRMDMLGEARSAILAQRARVGRHDVLCAGDALSLATLDAARALGLDREIGSLEPGKSADLAAFPLHSRVMPVHDPEAAAIFALPGVPASLVTVAGRELVRDGALLAADPALESRVEVAAQALRDWSRS